MAIVLGVAFRNQSDESYVVDIVESPNAVSVFHLIRKMEGIDVSIRPEEEARLRLRTGKSMLAVTAPEGDRNLKYEFDPQRPGSVEARNTVDSKLQTANGRKDVFDSDDVHFSEPGGRYIDFLIPGLLAMGLMGGGLWGVGYGVVDLRIRKLLKRFMATPMKRSHFLLSMLISRLVFMVPQIFVLMLFAWLYFDVKIYGS